MGEFYTTDFGFSRMSEAELHARADRGGRLGGCGMSYACPDRTGPVRFGYQLRVIATGGMGNCGIGVLCGTTPETRQRVRAGRAVALAAEHGVSYDFADTIISVGGYAAEAACVQAIIAEWDNPAFALAAMPDHCRAWCHDHGIDMHGLSVPRFRCVMEACQRLYRAFRCTSPKKVIRSKLFRA